MAEHERILQDALDEFSASMCSLFRERLRQYAVAMWQSDTPPGCSSTCKSSFLTTVFRRKALRCVAANVSYCSI